MHIGIIFIFGYLYIIYLFLHLLMSLLWKTKDRKMCEIGKKKKKKNGEHGLSESVTVVSVPHAYGVIR